MTGSEPHALVSWGTAIGLVVLAAILHFYALALPPRLVHGDEVHFGVHAHSLATRAEDLNGRVLPVFFAIRDPLIENHSHNVWFQPSLFYAVAAVFSIAGVSETSLRAAPALIGILNVGLLYVLGLQLFRDVLRAATAATLLLLTPAHVIFSRVAADYICSVPFVIGWLLLLVRWGRLGRSSHLFWAGLLLGLGFYSYIAAWIMMPVYLAFTLLFVWWSSSRPWKPGLAAVLGFALPMLLLASWLWQYPTMLDDTLARYRFAAPAEDASLIARFTSPVATRISTYWHYFNPGYLFLSGGSNLLDSTRRVGLFLVPVAVFLVAGLHTLWGRRHEPLQRLALMGFVTAPLAAVAMNERFTADRELFLLPFGAIVATYGVWQLWGGGRLARRLAFVALLATPVHFGIFYYDYVLDYPRRTFGVFDPYDFRQIALHVTSTDRQAPVPAVFLSKAIQYGSYRWKFHLLTHGRDDLFQRTRYLDEAALAKAPAGSLFIMAPNDPSPLQQADRLLLDTTIVDAGGSIAAVILRATSP